MPKTLQGVQAIVHTPFTDRDEIDLPTMQKEVDWIFAQQADGVGTGMVSEILKLTADERVALSQELAAAVNGRGTVFMAVGAESTKQAIYYAKAAEKAGCDAVMAVPPLTTRLNEATVTAHFVALAEAVSIPIIVQDASGYVGQAIPMGVYRELLKRFGREKILFKPEAAPNGPTLSAVRDATDGQAQMFEGSGGVFLIDSYRRGVIGTMPGVDLLDGIVAIWQALKRGDDETAYAIFYPISAIVSLQLQAGLDGFLAIEKHLLHLRGLFPSTRRRQPYGWELDRETAAEVDRLFAHLQTALKTRGRG